MNIVIAPDSFKGSVSSIEVGNCVKSAFQQVFPAATIEVIPMADGGEGTVEALLYATGGRQVEVEVTGPLNKPTRTVYGILGDEKTVVIEVASIAGLPMVPVELRNPLNTTTYGVGEAILHAINQGYRQFIIGLGGSATNDAGVGMLQVLGAVFLNEQGEAVQPIGASLAEVVKVDISLIDPRLRECHFQIASDVKNPLCGPMGASHVFAPQKGATKEQIQLMDEAMKRFATLVESHLNLDSESLQKHPGAGAAGGLGFAFLVLGGQLLPGAQIVSEAIGLEEKIEKCDWVITGEGQSDYQTAFGKVPFYIGSMAKRANKPAILLSGSLGEGADKLHEVFVSLHSIAPGPVSLDHCMKNGSLYISQAATNIARLISAASS